MGKLAGKTAVVTGGGRGIGKAIVHRFYQEGCRLMIADVDGRAGEAAALSIDPQGQKVRFIEADVSREQDVARVMQETADAFGHIDVLVNNACIFLRQATLSLDLEAWNRCLSLCLTAPFLAAREAIPYMLRRDGGVILNISSIHGVRGGTATAAYDAAKGGLNALTQSLAVEWGPRGIRVNAIAPGLIERQGADLSADKLFYPVRRVGRVEDIAAAAVFLASEEASFINGHCLLVDGGITAWLNDDMGENLIRSMNLERDRE